MNEYTKKIFFSLMVVDLVILLKVPILRQVFAFLYFVFVPGLLVLQALGVGKCMRLANLIVYSIGLSLSLTMFLGLLLNFFVSKPLSTYKLITLFNLFIFSLLLVINLDKKDLAISIFKGNSIKYPEIGFLLLVPFLFVFGMYFLDYFKINVLVLFSFFVVIFLCTIIYLRELENLYIFAVAITSLSLSLLFGLRYTNIPVGDISYEYFTFKQTSVHLFWNLYYFKSRLNAMLSITILPTVYSQLLGVSGRFVFLKIYRILFSLCPVIVFLLCENITENRKNAFLASIFSIVQFPFMSVLGQMARVEIAYIFFFLSILVIYDRNLNKKDKYFLFFVYTTSVVFSHYSTTVLYILILICTSGIIAILKKLKFYKNNLNTDLSCSFIFELFVVLVAISFVWYGIITYYPFRDIILAADKGTSRLLESPFTLFIHHNVFVKNNKIISYTVPYVLTKYIYLLSIFLILVGVLSWIFNSKNVHSRYYISFLSFNISSFLILIFAFFVSSVYGVYGPERFFYQYIIFTSLMYVEGCDTFAVWVVKFIKKLFSFLYNFDFPYSFSSYIVVALIILQFLAGTYLLFCLFNVHYAEYLSVNSIRYSKFCVHDSDLLSAGWLYLHSSRLGVWSDFYGRQIYAQFNPLDSYEGVGYLIPINKVRGYIFLRYWNAKYKFFDTKYYGLFRISLLKFNKFKSLIYNDGSMIFL